MASVTVVGLARPEVERYVSRAELAEIMGVSVDTVKRLQKAGMPSVSWGDSGRVIRYRPSVALAWARARSRG